MDIFIDEQTTHLFENPCWLSGGLDSLEMWLWLQLSFRVSEICFPNPASSLDAIAVRVSCSLRLTGSSCMLFAKWNQVSFNVWYLGFKREDYQRRPLYCWLALLSAIQWLFTYVRNQVPLRSNTLNSNKCDSEGDYPGVLPGPVSCCIFTWDPLW